MSLVRSAAASILVLGVTLVGGTQTSAQERPTPFTGIWRGQVLLPSIPLRVVLQLTPRASTYSGSIEFPDESPMPLHFDSVTVSGDTMIVMLPRLRVRLAVTLDADGKMLHGTWARSGFAVPVELRRGSAFASSRRPQDPVPPLPYREEFVKYHNPAGGNRLTGTLALPPGDGPHPAVLLLSGSGRQDRDGTMLGHHWLRVLSDHLVRRGFVVLRVDDRGIGGSDGPFETATIQDFAEDALAGVAFLATRAEVRPGQIGLIGHSEGGVVASLAAARSSQVGFLVLLATPGVPGTEIARMQSMERLRRMTGDSAFLARMDTAYRKLFAAARDAPDEASAGAAARASLATALNVSGTAGGPAVDALLSTVTQRFASPQLRALLRFDPAPVLRQVHVPVLALTGSLDTQVEARTNLAGLRQALRDGGNRQADVRELPGLNHLLQTAKTGLPAEYADSPETISPRALAAVADWLEALKLSARPTKESGPTRRNNGAIR